jgi:hypothetical protein
MYNYVRVCACMSMCVWVRVCDTEAHADIHTNTKDWIQRSRVQSQKQTSVITEEIQTASLCVIVSGVAALLQRQKKGPAMVYVCMYVSGL